MAIQLYLIPNMIDFEKDKLDEVNPTTKLTEELFEKFLELLQENGGIVGDACKDLKVSRTAMYKERHADPAFRDRWDAAVDRGIDVLEDEAKRRALLGDCEDIYYEGEVIGYRWKKSDTLMTFILKAHRNKYIEKLRVDGDGSDKMLQIGILLGNSSNGNIPVEEKLELLKKKMKLIEGKS